jgi:hypothetical protein
MRFLINTLTHFEEPPRARHQVAYALSRKFKVVFIAANKPGLPGLKNLSVHENLSVVVPYFPIDNRIRYRLPLVNEFYQHWLFRQLARQYKDYEVINFDFTATKIYQYFSRVIYYCNDSFSAISKHINPAFIAGYHQRCESEVASKAMFCVAVSEKLKENLIPHNPDSFEIPLGSPDIDEYNLPINFAPSRKLPVEVGFVGFIKSLNLSHKILNLLLADDRLRITLIGPVEDNFLEYIDQKDKLILKGSLTGRRLYEEINKFDVTIAPYSARLINDVNSGVGTGSKIYHYFSLGKPVVISYMEGLRKLDLPEGVIYIAQKEEDFPSLIFRAVEEDSEELIRQRIRFARNNTWEKRMEALTDLYQRFS